MKFHWPKPSLIFLLLCVSPGVHGTSFGPDLEPCQLRAKTRRLFLKNRYDTLVQTPLAELLMETLERFPQLDSVEKAIQREGVDGVGGPTLGIWKVQMGNEDYLLKEFASDHLPAIGTQTRWATAEALHELGLGPKTYYLEKNGRTFFLSEFEKGVNIKELVDSPRGLPVRVRKKLREKIEKMTGKKYRTLDDARRALAKSLLNHSSDFAHLRHLLTELEKQGWNFHDFQYMVNLNPETQRLEFSIIDPDLYTLPGRIPPDHARKGLQDYKRQMRELQILGQGSSPQSAEFWDPFFNGF